MHTKRIIVMILALGMITSVVPVAQAADTPESQQDAIGETPPRLSLTDGEVSFWRPGAEDWSQAQVNTPLAPGDRVHTGPNGNIEIQIGSRAFVRGGANTELGLESHEPDFIQLQVTAGKASFDLRTVEPGRTVEVDTPNAAFTVEHAGYYRLDVSDERTSFIARRGGQATVTSASGQPVTIGPSEEVVIEGEEGPRVSYFAAPQLDEWDKWNYARTDHVLDSVSARYVSSAVYGVEELDRHGTWRSVPSYGAVWVPRGVPAGWAPYSTGAWIHDPYYGWTWVDTAPWGWAPYHYGRWVHVNGFWAWAPGPVVARPAYSPALVAFFAGADVGVNVRIGGPVLGWVALGWGEPCVPWWGPTRIRHRPWWGGWGGPRVVNNVVVHKTTVVNVKEITHYHNTNVRNGIVAVGEKHFGRGPIHSARVSKVDEKRLRPIHTAPQVSATPASFAAGEGRGIRPPEKILKRSVVATRTAQPKREIPAGTGRKAESVRVPTPAPRIVSAPEKSETATVPQRPPFGQRKFERRTTDRDQPPRPPRVEGQRGSEQANKGTPSVTRQTQPPRQRESQAAPPAPVKPETSARQPGADRTRQPARVEGQRGSEQANKGTPSVTRQTQPPRQRESQVTAPSPTRPQSLGRPAEVSRSPARVLPGEPANRLSPNRSNTGPQQQRDRKESPRSARPDNTPRKGSPEALG
jgi:hypothetical protein